MITEVIMPKLGQTMEQGAIVEWVKKEGDPVQRGDLLFTVESDKAVLEVDATARGFLRRVLVPEGQVVPVLTAVALITRQADEDISSYGVLASPAAVAESKTTAAAKPSLPTPVSDEHTKKQATGRIFASPRARKAAREKGLDMELLIGTGPNGRIVEQDVLNYLASQPKATPMAQKTAEVLGVDLSTVAGTGISGRIMQADVAEAAPPAAGEAVTAPPGETQAAVTLPMTGLRHIIAERMAVSDTATARVTLVTEADATSLVEGREQLKATVSEEWGFAPGYNDILGLIVARALREFPYMNTRLGKDSRSIEQFPYVNLGMAVDTERGLLVPVIHGADQKGLRGFGTKFRALADRARAGKSLPDDLSGGTFTITSLGTYDIDAFTPIINLPEAAILGVGRIQPKPVVRHGEIVARQMWTLSLVFDHRLVDGAPAARFLQRIKQMVENPFLLLG